MKMDRLSPVSKCIDIIQCIGEDIKENPEGSQDPEISI